MMEIHIFMENQRSTTNKAIAFYFAFTIITSASYPIIQSILSPGNLNIYNLFRTFYSNGLRFFLVLQFWLACFFVQSRFSALNEFLKSFITSSRFSSVKTLTLFKCARVFHSLCDSIEIINQTFTVHFICMIFYTMVS